MAILLFGLKKTKGVPFSHGSGRVNLPAERPLTSYTFKRPRRMSCGSLPTGTGQSTHRCTLAESVRHLHTGEPSPWTGPESQFNLLAPGGRWRWLVGPVVALHTLVLLLEVFRLFTGGTPRMYFTLRVFRGGRHAVT